MNPAENDRKANQDRFHYLTETKVSKLITRLSVPTIISMLVTAVYNAADTFFVGRISTQATAAVGLAFSAMAVIQALGFFYGQGSDTTVMINHRTVYKMGEGEPWHRKIKQSVSK